MDFRLKIHDNPVHAEVVGRGDAVARDFTRITEELIAHNGYFTGIGFLHDYRDVNVANLTVSDVQSIALMVASYHEILGNGKWAILVTNDLEYGMTRMWFAFVEESVDLEIRIFRDESEARSWLADS